MTKFIKEHVLRERDLFEDYAVHYFPMNWQFKGQYNSFGNWLYEEYYVQIQWLTWQKAREELFLENSNIWKIYYTNYRGETSLRTITPLSLRFGSTDWHKEDQWLLKALCHNKNEVREFAVKDFGEQIND